MQPLFQKRAAGAAAQFYLRCPENLLLVKREENGEVLICATADNLSMEQRAAFVRYLHEEGFVSAALEIPVRTPEWSSQTVRWIVDPVWPEPDPTYLKHLRRLGWCLAGTIVVWLALVVALVCY